MQPFRTLLQPKTQFIGTEELDSLFEEAKAIIIQKIQRGMEIVDKNKPTCMATEGWHLIVATTKALHMCIKQTILSRTGWKVTLVGSHFTSPAESRYAPIEGEALAVVDALNKARHFVLGCPNLINAVDHKPLLKVFSDPNPRLRNLKEKTLKYRF
ncbi:hypothetical protein RRG08_054573 [Elysia crispata]|uniref:Reverse transcriptase RNase H-like domain-containing protein n=1 Tax=Elysia crispata TaxID=231223 RepID=A0AAE1B0N1_9GAST|nr:hypothetical protein RRG08_054573 [Elysia crispata]